MRHHHRILIALSCYVIMTQQPSSAFDMSDMNLLSRSPESLSNIKSTSPSTIANELYPSWDLLPLEQLHLDTVGDLPDLLPRLAAKYKLGTNDWVGIKQDPRLYLLSEMQSTQEPRRAHHDADKRGRGGSLSIVQPMDVLRQRMLMEIARRNQQHQVRQVVANRQLLANLGKRNNQHRIKQNQRVNDPDLIANFQEYDDYTL